MSSIKKINFLYYILFVSLVDEKFFFKDVLYATYVIMQCKR